MPSKDIVNVGSPRDLATPQQPLEDVTGDYKTIGWEGWFTCDRSGFNFPISQRVWQNGLQVGVRFADEPGRLEQSGDPRTLDMKDIENPYGF